MNYFVTGGAGFIGSNMVNHILQDDKNSVTVFDNFCSGQMSYIERHLNDSRFNLIEGDMLDLNKLNGAIKGHDFVFHFAANPDIARSMIETDLDLRLGIVATYNLVEAMRRNNVKNLAYSSGSGVYGDVGTTETPENFGPLLPISMYGASKLGAEGIISAFSFLYDIQSWIFRFANVVGRNQTHGVGFDFVNKLRKNPQALAILGDGTQSKSYIHVEDVINAIFFVIHNTKESINIFNIATDDYITVSDIAQIVTEVMGLNNVDFQYSGGSRGWQGDVPVVRFNLEKIHTLGWKSTYSSRQAIKKSIEELLTEH